MHEYLKRSELPMAERSWNTDMSVSQRRTLIGALAACTFALLAFLTLRFFYPPVDDKALLDQQIEEQWMVGRQTVDALEFFQQGGVYENRPGSIAEQIDQQHVIPLLRTIHERHQLSIRAILHEEVPKQAVAVIVQVPPDRAGRNALRKTIVEATDAFPGLLTQFWSHRWVSLDFFDEEEAIAHKMAGSFEKLKASQRIPE